ncbi:oligoendopeptidase F [Geobacillus sp. FSL K6-0789]|uniref:Oligopeptidase F n=2 Tax=Geobacillus stearothermophilus TaxID=1422 RepID=A0A0K9HUY2_GEOSE|nr:MULTISPECIES: oligoendopeptidase F [Geobacillus]KAF6510917.1 Oligoendopeptidase F [Geobacillus stearothermophilus]KMY60279.1 oligopeptidase PepB [Geobacillus stearothermophilus]KMY62079.1 oligopeptidase PepB [Geobacillus stearothermophilus]KMY62748.1 oligopeptidase PepB [Geobacillus stearothermophilus]MBR2515813.1 oligoendopeptidase F [Geobacillus sp.]
MTVEEKKAKKSLPLRSEIPVEETWRLEDIFPTDDAWEEEFKQVKALIPKLGEYKGRLGESPEVLYEALQYQDDVSMRLGKLYTYAHMRYDQDTTNSFYQGLDARAKSLYSEASSAMAFIVPEILAIDEAVLRSFLEQYEPLRLYAHALDEITRQRPHVLSAEEEAILAQAAEVMQATSDTFSALNNADLTFPTIIDENGEEVEVTHGRFIRFLESTDRRVRRDAFHAVYHTYEKFQNTFASTLAGTVKKHNFFARVRRYESARQAALDANNIPESVYDNLIATVHEHLPLLHRYVRLRKQVLGLDELHMYDLYTPLVQDVKMDVTYEEAKQYMLDGLAPLGEEYVAIVKEGLDNRWVDVRENKGKRSGAYSSGAYGTHPYILLNWQDNVHNLFTLVHEFGHSVHSYYTRKTQPYPYAHYSIFVAEVASTCNEALLNDHLLKTIDDEKKRLYLLNHYLEGFRGTVFRQTMFAEFEHLIHLKAQQGEALTAETLTSLYYDLNKKYFGDEIVVDQEIGLEWSRIPHFYYNYYVYQYATGFSAATALSKQILEEGEPAVKRYIDFLKAGSSDYPIEVLKKAGVDMTSAEPIRQACQVFAEKLDEMEQLLEK